MNLYKITLPMETNSGASAAKAQQAFETFVSAHVGGFTKLPIAEGCWTDNTGHVYLERVVSYEIACEVTNWPHIVGKAFALFPDQKAIFWARLTCEAHIQLR